VEPVTICDVTSLGDADPQCMPGRWPDGDHEHAVSPPMPEELEQDAQKAHDRIVNWHVN
jgi:hypothetical protein